MKSPYTGNETIVVSEVREMTFRKEQFNLIFHAYKCVDTGKQFEDESFAELNYNQVINQYRAKYCIPFPEQIIAIRRKYDLSAAKMSEVLGMGANTWSNYENGEVPSKV
ncbi:MAG: type II toxin-antitoxin system MqsA family antitoxin, partial [Prolixibacteraceae bacterium]|nr:type II toxin-antitoxin system MqsA family antitoxin [Prolixibacteraceae bacterium]